MATGLQRLESSLSAQERDFVGLAVQHPLDVAFQLAGYNRDDPNYRRVLATLTRKPAIIAALHIAIGRQLQLDAATARQVAMRLMNDEKVSDKVRSDLATKIMRMGGHVEPKQEQRDTTSDKSLAELSMQELRDRAEALERELSERARPVISAKAVPLDAQAIDIIDEH